MTNLEGMPHTGSESYVTAVLDRAGRLGYPTADVADETVAAGEASWGAWVAGADRAQLVQALRVLTVRAHRVGKA